MNSPIFKFSTVDGTTSICVQRIENLKQSRVSPLVVCPLVVLGLLIVQSLIVHLFVNDSNVINCFKVNRHVAPCTVQHCIHHNSEGTHTSPASITPSLSRSTKVNLESSLCQNANASSATATAASWSLPLVWTVLLLTAGSK